MNRIKISTARNTHQHHVGTVPFTLIVHSAAVSVGYRIVAAGFGETLSEAVAQAVANYREGR